MLKTFLIAGSVLALSAGAAAAQTTALSDIEQIGNTHSATVTQSNNADSFVFQANGDGNTATVEQRSNLNLSVIHQAGPYATGYPSSPSTPAPNQFGMIGFSNNNTATVRQLAGSDDASSSVNQSGNGNTATVTQTQVGNANARQSTRMAAQESVYPDSIVDQAGFGNVVAVNQDGDLSRSSVYQGYTEAGGSVLGKPFGTLGGALDTSTESNYVGVTQTAGATNANSDVLQAGDGNYATAYQSITGVQSAIRQQGNSNTVQVFQQNVAYAQSGVSQIGNGNIAYVSQ